MPNYLSIDEAASLSGMPKETFIDQYIERGIISVKVEDGIKSIELSEFLRVFPNAKSNGNANSDSAVEVLLKEQKIESLEYQVVQLQRQLEKQTEDYNWLRNKFDSTTLLLEQKLDTSELNQHKQEIRKLSEQSIQWEKKYNTLLAANELKTLIKENKDLKEKLESAANKLNSNPMTNRSNDTFRQQMSPTTDEIAQLRRQQQPPVTNNSQQNFVRPAMNTQQHQDSSSETSFKYPSQQPVAPAKKRRKIFGIF